MRWSAPRGRAGSRCSRRRRSSASPWTGDRVSRRGHSRTRRRTPKACGRRSPSAPTGSAPGSRARSGDSTSDGRRASAFVAHVAGVRGMADRAEMHVSGQGYVGLNAIGGGITNVALVVPQRRAALAAGRVEAFFMEELDRFPGVRGRVQRTGHRARGARHRAICRPRTPRDRAGRPAGGRRRRFLRPLHRRGHLRRARRAPSSWRRPMAGVARRPSPPSMPASHDYRARAAAALRRQVGGGAAHRLRDDWSPACSTTRWRASAGGAAWPTRSSASPATSCRPAPSSTPFSLRGWSCEPERRRPGAVPPAARPVRHRRHRRSPRAMPTAVPHGMTANSLASVSLEPPLVSLSIDHEAAMHRLLMAAPAFAINILASNQETLCRRFAQRPRGAVRRRRLPGESRRAHPARRRARPPRVRAHRHARGRRSHHPGRARGGGAAPGRAAALYFRGGYAVARLTMATLALSPIGTSCSTTPARDPAIVTESLRQHRALEPVVRRGRGGALRPRQLIPGARRRRASPCSMSAPAPATCPAVPRAGPRGAACGSRGSGSSAAGSLRARATGRAAECRGLCGRAARSRERSAGHRDDEPGGASPSRDAAVEVIRAADRVARVGVVLADLRRSSLAVAGFRARQPGCSGSTRRPRADGVTSVRRGYRPMSSQRFSRDAGVQCHGAPAARVPSRGRLAAPPDAHGGPVPSSAPRSTTRLPRRRRRGTLARAPAALSLGPLPGAAGRRRGGGDVGLPPVRSASTGRPGGCRRCGSTPARRAVRYRHVRGVTTGMDVEWTLRDTADGRGRHDRARMERPAVAADRRPAAEWVIGPVFVHGIASRTLAGLKRAVRRKRQ